MSAFPKVYLETTIASYLTARQSRDLFGAACQEITRDWWANSQNKYQFFVSRIVLREASLGDSEAAQRRLAFLKPWPMLELTDQIEALATRLVQGIPLPPKAQADSLHIALAAVHQIDYLLTWNCTHIANATLRTRLETICQDAGFKPPIVCTPLELRSQGENDA